MGAAAVFMGSNLLLFLWNHTGPSGAKARPRYGQPPAVPAQKIQNVQKIIWLKITQCLKR